MPKTGMEPLRRRALIDATISAIGARGSLDVTMSEIAGRAGVSSALAHHYFGAKDELLQATMRHILAELALDARAALGAASSPRERVLAGLAGEGFRGTNLVVEFLCAVGGLGAVAQHVLVHGEGSVAGLVA